MPQMPRRPVRFRPSPSSPPNAVSYAWGRPRATESPFSKASKMASRSSPAASSNCSPAPRSRSTIRARSKLRWSCRSSRSMRFTDIFIKRPVLATVVSLLILLVGAQAGFKLPIRQYPELSNTTMTVITSYPGANADLIQGFITVPIQQAVASAEGIDTLTASSTQNVSTVTLNLKLDADPDRAMTDVLSKVAQVKSILPREANDSIVTKKTGEGYALMYLSFNSKVMTASQISDYLTRVVQPKLQTINGVANAEILGGQVFAMRIWLDPDRMASLAATPLHVRVALAST